MLSVLVIRQCICLLCPLGSSCSVMPNVCTNTHPIKLIQADKVTWRKGGGKLIVGGKKEPESKRKCIQTGKNNTVHLKYRHMLSRETSSKGPRVRAASVRAVWNESSTYCRQVGNGEVHMLRLLAALQHLHSNQHARHGRHVFIRALH